MKKFSEFICKNRVLVLIVSFALLILSFIGMKLTKINYDILVYLPDDIETIKGQNILTDEFNMGAYAMVITDNLKADEILKVEEKMRKVDGVNKVVSLYDALGTDFPIEVLPDDIRSHLNKDNSNLLLVTFEESTSSEKTIDAVRELRTLSDNYKIGGMSSMVLDTMDLSNSEIAIYIVIAVVLCLVVLAFSLDSYLVPVLLLLNIGMAIMYNMGTNIFLGEISYITKALVAVLQLGVTTDFSIFLYHSYENKKNKMSKEKAMEEAISETFTSVTGSSLTTIAGFLVLCLMNLTLGKDLGIVMAKGVLLGLVSVLTVFPALLLTFDKYISKTSHKVIIKPFNKVNNFIVKHYIAIFIIFLLLLFPMYKANSKVEVYYKIDETLPKTLESISSNEEIKEKITKLGNTPFVCNNINIDIDRDIFVRIYGVEVEQLRLQRVGGIVVHLRAEEDDAVHHQHVWRRQLRAFRAEQFTTTRGKKIFFCIGFAFIYHVFSKPYFKFGTQDS